MTTKSVRLASAEILALFDPTRTKGDAGFQGLLDRLRKKCDKHTGEMVLDFTDAARIRKYAFEAERPEWTYRLRNIFRYHLGEQLDQL